MSNRSEQGERGPCRRGVRAVEVASRAVELVKGGSSVNEAARLTGASASAVRNWCRSAGVRSAYRQYAPERGGDPPRREEVGESRRKYLLRLLRAALPEAIREVRERRRALGL